LNNWHTLPLWGNVLPYNTLISNQEMKPVKITAELTLTPEEFQKWCDGDILPSERMYHQFIEGTIYNKFGTTYDFGEYKDYINTTSIDDNGVKFTFEELK
jgi:hypothetical protein